MGQSLAIYTIAPMLLLDLREILLANSNYAPTLSPMVQMWFPKAATRMVQMWVPKAANSGIDGASSSPAASVTTSSGNHAETGDDTSLCVQISSILERNDIMIYKVFGFKSKPPN
jgi:hypothetical protein